MATLVVVLMVAAACGSSDSNGDGGDGGGAGGDGWSVSQCRDVDIPDHVDSPRIFGRFVVIDRIDEALAEQAVAFLSDSFDGVPVDLIDLVLDERYDVPDGIDRGGYVAILEESDLWMNVANRVSVVGLPNAEVDQALLALSATVPDVDVAPIHRVGFMSHWGAFPGTDAQICNLDGGDERPVVESSGALNVGVVDTGIVNPASVESGNAPPALKLDRTIVDCEISHGEFVVNVARMTNPGATMYASNAFPVANGECWETGEDQVLAATAALIFDSDGDLDVINYSLGAETHAVMDESEGVLEFYEPLLTRVMKEEVLNVVAGATIYAAAGNTIPDPDRPIQPAALDDVIGVQASDAANEPIVWDLGTPVPATSIPWADMLAPGCDIIAVGTDDPSEVVIWSGSSFASPIAAAQVRTSDVMHDEFLGTHYMTGTPDPSQCAKP